MSLLAATMAALLTVGQGRSFVLATDPAGDNGPAAQAPAVTPVQQRIENVILAVKQYLGTPYRLGSEGPDFIDCSGLIFRAFSDVGLVDRIGGARMRAATYMRWFANRGRMTTDAAQAQRGDLVVYNEGSHMGIYLGDGRVISALVNPLGVTAHSLNGLSLPVTGFLRPDWTGDGDVPPFVPVDVPDVPEVPATLVPGTDWLPALDASAAAPDREGDELLELRTPNSRTFANRDGTYTTEFHAQPIFYQPADTTDAQDLKPVDLAFSADDTTGYASATDSPVVVTTRPANDDAGFLTATAGDYSIGLSLATDAGMQASKSVPQVIDDGRVVDFFEFQGQQVGLRVLARTDGFKSFVVLGKAPDRNRFSFVLNAPGLTPTIAEDGSIVLTDDAGNVVGRMPSPLLLDTSDIDGTGGGVFTSAASWNVDTSAAAPVLTAVVDRDFLEEAVMPAYLDISLVGFPQASAGADVTFVSSSHPNASMNGFQRPESAGFDDVWVGRQPSTRNDNDALIRFNGLSQLLGTVDVASASLELLPYMQRASDGVTVVRRATSDWSASTVTWTTQPTVDDTDLATSKSDGGSWTSIDVSSYVTDVLSHGATDYGLVLSGDDSGGQSWKRVAASDAGESAEFGPRLVVTWSGLRPAAQPSVNGSELNWIAPELAGAQMRFQVQVSHDGFATTDVDSGTVKGKDGKLNTWTLPADATTAPYEYEWRVRVKFGSDQAWSPWSNAVSLTLPEANGSLAPDDDPVPHGAMGVGGF